MSLDVAKLEKVRELGGGIVQARCPACAEGGNDRSGEHLRIYPDGKFGCCVHPKDGDHRKRIWALVGIRKPGIFSLRLKTPPALPPAQSVTAALIGFGRGTLGTGKSESVSPAADNSAQAELITPESGTLGTANLKLRARARVDSSSPNIDRVDFQVKLEDLAKTVPSVPTAVVSQPPSAAGERLPFLTAGGDLSIPFDSPERYHWWRGGQSVAATIQEVKERMNHAVIV
jgi:hypothetical protein